MSFTDFYFDREEKRISNQTKELITNEFESKENLENIFANLQDFKNSLEISLEDDEEISISLQAYGDEFMRNAYELLERVRKFEKQCKKLFWKFNKFFKKKSFLKLLTAWKLSFTIALIVLYSGRVSKLSINLARYYCL